MSQSTEIPMFLMKLWNLVDESSTTNLIRWSAEGKSFIVADPPTFSRVLLPQYFKHRNMASFIRVLNMYGFRKVVHPDTGSLRSVSDEMEFQHPAFQRGQKDSLASIKRKSTRSAASAAATAAAAPVRINSANMQQLLNEVSVIRNRQDDVSSMLDDYRRENEQLWDEVQRLRRKHQEQQTVVHKLIQFLLALFRQGSHVIQVPQQPALLAAPSSTSGSAVSAPVAGGYPQKRIRLDRSPPTIQESGSSAFVQSPGTEQIGRATPTDDGGALIDSGSVQPQLIRVPGFSTALSMEDWSRLLNSVLSSGSAIPMIGPDTTTTPEQQQRIVGDNASFGGAATVVTSVPPTPSTSAPATTSVPASVVDDLQRNQRLSASILEELAQTASPTRSQNAPDRAQMIVPISAAHAYNAPLLTLRNLASTSREQSDGKAPVKISERVDLVQNDLDSLKGYLMKDQIADTGVIDNLFSPDPADVSKLLPPNWNLPLPPSATEQSPKPESVQSGGLNPSLVDDLAFDDDILGAGGLGDPGLNTEAPDDDYILRVFEGLPDVGFLDGDTASETPFVNEPTSHTGIAITTMPVAGPSASSPGTRTTQLDVAAARKPSFSDLDPPLVTPDVSVLGDTPDAATPSNGSNGNVFAASLAKGGSVSSGARRQSRKGSRP